MKNVTIRDALQGDTPAIRDIYAHEVQCGLASFEEVPPTISEMAERLDEIRQLSLPFLVAEVKGEVVGFAYARKYRPRPAYRSSIENSVYLKPEHRGLGLASNLLAKLIERCDEGPWRQMIAVIGDSGNIASINLHKRHGFREVGVLYAVGFKLGRWVDTVIMQRALGEGAKTVPNHAALSAEARAQGAR